MATAPEDTAKAADDKAADKQDEDTPQPTCSCGSGCTCGCQQGGTCSCG